MVKDFFFRLIVSKKELANLPRSLKNMPSKGFKDELV